MDFKINNDKEMNSINSFLSRTIKKDNDELLDAKMYNDVLGIVDEKINVIANELYLIMSSKNHPNNFLPHNDAWEMYRDLVFNGPTMFNGLLEDQLYLLVNKISSELAPHYRKAITYFYSNDIGFEDNELLIDSLSSEIGWSAFSKIQEVLHGIVEKEQELEWKLLAEIEEEEERKAYKIELYLDIEILTKRQMINQQYIEKVISNYSGIKNNEKPKVIKLLNDEVHAILKEFVSIIEHQETKLEYYDELIKIQEKENDNSLVDLNKQISKERSNLKILKNKSLQLEKQGILHL
jgi:hypothetical protein